MRWRAPRLLIVGVLAELTTHVLPGLPSLIVASCVGVATVAVTLWLTNRWLGLERGGLLALVLKRGAA